MVYGDQLDIFGLGSIQATTVGTGTVNLFELSLDSATDLNDLQAGSFVLATLTYELLARGTSPLDITSAVLSDAFGEPLEADVSGGTINAQSVPEPATIFLVGSGLLGIAGCTRKIFKR